VVSNTVALTSALANTAVGRIVLAPGTYILNAELSITRSVVLEAAVAGSVVLDAQASSSSQRRVLYIQPGSLDVVQLIGLNITGGNVQVRVAENCEFPIAPMGKCLADMPNLTLAFHLGSIFRSTRDLYVPDTPAKPHRPHGKMADMPKSTLIFQFGSIFGSNREMYVPATAHACKPPIAPMGKLLMCLPRLTLAQLRTLRSTTGGECCRDLAKFPLPRWENC
jgi:hypothetical protein